MTHIYKRVVAEGIEHSNHESDLYTPVTNRTRELVAEHEYVCNVTTFRSNIDDKLWYDIPFAYLPFWDRKLGSSDKPSHYATVLP